MRLTKNYEHVMCILNVTKGDGLHNHSCYIACERKEKNDWFCFALCKYCTVPNIFKKPTKLKKTYQTKIQCPCSWHWNKVFEVAYLVEQVLVLVEGTYSMIDLVVCFA